MPKRFLILIVSDSDCRRHFFFSFFPLQPRAGELVGDKEADDTDRKRARRKKKIQKHVERVERERAELKAERQKKGTLLDGAADSRGSKDATEEKRAAMKKLEDSAKQGLAVSVLKVGSWYFFFPFFGHLLTGAASFAIIMQNVTFVDKKAPRTKLSSSHVFSKLQSEVSFGGQLPMSQSLLTLLFLNYNSSSTARKWQR